MRKKIIINNGTSTRNAVYTVMLPLAPLTKSWFQIEKDILNALPKCQYICCASGITTDVMPYLQIYVEFQTPVSKNVACGYWPKATKVDFYASQPSEIRDYVAMLGNYSYYRDNQDGRMRADLTKEIGTCPTYKTPLTQYEADESPIFEMVRQYCSNEQIMAKYPSAEDHIDEIEAYRAYCSFDPNYRYEMLMKKDSKEEM